MSDTWHIFGNSRSLLEEEGLEDLHPSIGVNRILRMAEPDYLLLVDHGVARREKKRIDQFNGRLILYDIRPMFQLFHGRAPRPIPLKLSTKYSRMKSFEGDYARASNTGAYAIEFAARKIHHGPGKGRILLHGMDFRVKKGQPSHFFGDGSKEGCSSRNWKDVLKRLKKTVAFLQKHGIRVLNASPWHGPLDSFMERADAGT